MNTTPRALYEHRQFGWPMIVGAIVPFVCLVVIWSAAPPDRRTLSPALVPLLCIAVAVLVIGFSWLSTIVTTTHVVIRFGIGLYRRAIPLERIERVTAVRSRWYDGWGIRWTRQGMLYNVAGLDAVRVDLVDGRSLRIGTDEPGRLRSAIQYALDEYRSRASR